MIQEAIVKLAEYGVVTGLIGEEDRIYVQNRLLEVLGLDELECDTDVSVKAEDLEDILKEMLDYAVEQKLI